MASAQAVALGRAAARGCWWLRRWRSLALPSRSSGAGSVIERLRDQPTLLESIRATHTLRVAVRADHPQSQPALNALDGYDLAVAGAVADRLGVRLNLAIVPAGDLPMPGPAGAVIAMPSRAIPAATAAQLVVSQPYYRWPVYLTRPLGDRAAPTLAEIAGSRVCVVAGSAGEAWLTGRAAQAGVESVQAPPSGVTVVIRDDDNACLDAIARREADAAVTASLLPGDLTASGGAIVGGGPVAREPAVIVLSAGKGVGQLQATIDGVLQEMRRDGTLRALSLQWFGGEDLTSP